MADTVRLTIAGESVVVPAGTTVAAAAGNAGRLAVRRSVGGEPRGPVCGIGVCFECRVTIDGRPHQRACLIACREGMVVEPGDA